MNGKKVIAKKMAQNLYTILETQANTYMYLPICCVARAADRMHSVCAYVRMLLFFHFV